MTGHRMTNRDAIWEYVNAGRATFTIVSGRTGERMTFRVRARDRVSFVSVRQAETYRYVGIIDEGGNFRRTRKTQVEGRIDRAFRWVYESLRHGVNLDKFEVWHEGTCGRCARPLTVPESIEAGLGPECRRKI